MTGRVLPKRLGRSRTDMVNTVRLLDLPDEAIGLIDTGELSKGALESLTDRTGPSPTPPGRSAGGGTTLVRPATRDRDQPTDKARSAPV